MQFSSGFFRLKVALYEGWLEFRFEAAARLFYRTHVEVFRKLPMQTSISAWRSRMISDLHRELAEYRSGSPVALRPPPVKSKGEKSDAAEEEKKQKEALEKKAEADKAAQKKADVDAKNAAEKQKMEAARNAEAAKKKADREERLKEKQKEKEHKLKAEADEKKAKKEVRITLSSDCLSPTRHFLSLQSIARVKHSR